MPNHTYKNLESAISVVRNYHLEVFDPEHRPAEFLTNKFQQWRNLKNKIKMDFFSWLHAQEKLLPKKPKKIIYFYNKEKEKLKVKFSRSGLVIVDGKCCDTQHQTGKILGHAMFIQDLNNNFYIAPHIKNKVQHSSLSGGNPVLSAGMLKIEKGKITRIINDSGHYQPGLKQIYSAVKAMPAHVFSSTAMVCYRKRLLPKTVNYLVNSSYSLLRFLGRCLDRIAVTIKKSPEEFLAYAEQKLKVKQSTRSDENNSATTNRLLIKLNHNKVEPAVEVSAEFYGQHINHASFKFFSCNKRRNLERPDNMVAARKFRMG